MSEMNTCMTVQAPCETEVPPSDATVVSRHLDSCHLCPTGVWASPASW